MMAVLVPALAAVVAGVASYLVARIGHRTARESQGVQALGDALAGFKDLLAAERQAREDQQSAHDRQMAAMRSEMDRQRNDLTAVATEKDELTTRVGRLERALDAARRYVAVLINTLSAHSITPPDPPADYTH